VLIEEQVRKKAKKLIVAMQKRIDTQARTQEPGGLRGMPRQGELSNSAYEEEVMGFVRRHRRRYWKEVVPSVFPPEKLAREWEMVVKEFTKAHPKLFKKSFEKMWIGMLKKVREGLLDDGVFATLYVNIGTDESPHFVLARGSSQQEGLHSGIQSSFVKGAASAQTTFHKVHSFTANNNLKVSRKKCGLRIGMHSNDMELFNHVVHRAECLTELGVPIDMSGHVLRDWRFLKPGTYAFVFHIHIHQFIVCD
jgi:hypothetical protein